MDLLRAPELYPKLSFVQLPDGRQTSGSTEPLVLSAPDRETRAYWWLVFAVAALGVAGRIAAYLGQHSLWLDEARLALNVATRSYGELFPPLEFDQSAPLGFLWAARFSVEMLGVNEYGLRLVPLIAGLAVLPLAYAAGARLGGRAAGLFALVLAAVSDLLNYYTTEFKQYIVEAAVTYALVVLSLGVLREGPRSRAMTLLVIVGVLTPWVSAPGVFVLAGAAVSLGLGIGRASPKDRAALAIAGVAWALSFVIAYALVYRHAANTPYMHLFWQRAFVGSGGWLKDLWRIAVEFGSDGTLGPSGPSVWVKMFEPRSIVAVMLPLALAAIGVLVLPWRSSPAVPVLILGSLSVAIAASMARLYPLHGRTLVFALPLFQLLAALGAAHVLQRHIGSRGSWRWQRTTALILLALGLPKFLVRSAVSHGQPVRQMVAAVRAESRGEDVTYIAAGLIPTWTLYVTNWTAPDTAVVRWLFAISTTDGPAFENRDRLKAPPPFSHCLRRLTEHGVEVYGVGTGIQVAQGRPLTDPAPDPWWPDHEARRIRAAAREGSRVKVLLVHMRGTEPRLLEALRGQGFVVDSQQRRRGALVVDGRFAGAPAVGVPDSFECPVGSGR